MIDISHIVETTAWAALSETPSIRVCAAVLLWHETELDDCLMVSRKDNPDLWTLPGGKSDPEDWDTTDPERSSMRAAVRELREETGLRVELDQLKRVYATRTYHDGVANNRVVTMYLALKWTGTIYTTEPHGVKWGPPSEVEAGPFGDVYAYGFDKLGVRNGRLL